MSCWVNGALNSTITEMVIYLIQVSEMTKNSKKNNRLGEESQFGHVANLVPSDEKNPHDDSPVYHVSRLIEPTYLFVMFLTSLLNQL